MPLFLFIAMVLSGCASFGPQKTLVYSAKPYSPQTKVFLVAGSPDSANFAQEILDQKRLWLSRGVRPNEISCYYALPTDGWVYADLDQFTKLSDELTECYPANPRLFLGHLKQSLHQNPAYVYVYVSSHGNQPISEIIAREPNAEEKEKLISQRERYPFLDTFYISMTSLPNGLNFTDETLDEVAKHTIAVEDVLLTPKALAKVLKEGSARTKKIVVLQACHSGGFVETAEGVRGGANTLSGVPNLETLTASSPSRVSFGCHPGEVTTVFGAAVYDQLKAYRQRPDTISWKKIFNGVKKRVAVKELELFGDSQPSSEPLYFSSAARPKLSPLPRR